MFDDHLQIVGGDETLTDLQRAAIRIVQEVGYSQRVTDDVLGCIKVRLSSMRLGTTGLAKSLSRELGPYGITVNNVAPGTTMTDRIRPMIDAQAAAEGITFDEARAARAARIPVRRIGEPEDVAVAIVFLASAQARQITGQTLLVDGGETRTV